MRFTSQLVSASAVMALALCGTTSLHAQAYPVKTVRVVVPYAPGGSGDLMARVIGQKMADAWGQPVIVDNRPGAAGMIGAVAVAKSPADGHTILLGYVSEMAVNPSLYPKVAYDPARDFSTVAMAGILPLVLIVNPSLPVRSVKEMLALAKARPGELTFASSGLGAPAYLGFELLKTSAKVDMTNIPYKGGAEVVTAVIGGHVMMFFSSIPPAIPHVKTGRLRALAVSTASRVSSLPDTPTIAESGVRGFDIAGWFAYFVPAGTPRPAIEKIAEAANAALKDPVIGRQFEQQGIVVALMSPQELAAFIERDARRYAQIIKQAGVKAE